MTTKSIRHSWPLLVAALLGAGVATREGAFQRREMAARQAEPAGVRPTSLLQKGDRVAWVGSSSTKIGIWTKTVEFLVKTHHPALDAEFGRFSTGGGTFKTGVENLDGWLDEFEPTLVVLNYGGNDAGAGFHGLEKLRDGMGRCVEKVRSRGARPVLVTPQAADVRKAGREPAAKRKLYADVMLEHGRGQGWPVIDVHTPLESLQRHGERDDPSFTILKDRIHLNEPAYRAWGYYFYDRLDLPRSRSVAMLSAQGRVIWTTGCEVLDASEKDGVLSFTRVDRVLPVLPPGPLPPRGEVPMEALSSYQLRVVGLEVGDYEIRCQGKPVGTADNQSLALGVNLNSLLLDSGNEAPWADVAEAVWEGQTLEQVGPRAWRFEVRKRPGPPTAVDGDGAPGIP